MCVRTVDGVNVIRKGDNVVEKVLVVILLAGLLVSFTSLIILLGYEFFISLF